jgi:hypothetical protein
MKAMLLKLNGAGDRIRTGDVQLGKTTANWKQRTLRFLHLFLAIENNPVFTSRFGSVLNGAQTEHTLKLHLRIYRSKHRAMTFDLSRCYGPGSSQ